MNKNYPLGIIFFGLFSIGMLAIISFTVGNMNGLYISLMMLSFLIICFLIVKLSNSSWERSRLTAKSIESKGGEEKKNEM